MKYNHLNKKVGALLILTSLSLLAFGQKKKQDNNVDSDDTRVYLYYALQGPISMKKDTLYLEKDVYVFKNREGLFFKKPGQPAFPVPPEAFRNLGNYIFNNFLATDKYKILERLAAMPGLLKNSKIGIDIAKYQSQPAIDWAKVKKDTANAAVSFVIMRSTMGYNNTYDPTFEHNYATATANNFPVGLYHNFVLNKTKRPDFIQHARDQAYKFVSAFKNKHIDFKPILDIETDPKYAVVLAQFSPKEIRQATKAFIDIVEKELHTEVIIYTFETFYDTNLKGYFDTKYVWISRYPHSTGFGSHKGYPGTENPFLGISYDFKHEKFDNTLKNQSIGWQFSESGLINGIKSDVDMSIILNKDYSKWLK